MCGLVGFIDPHSQFSQGDGIRHVGRMADSLVHRGPDDRGVWCDLPAGVFLGHRRLAIQDLSPLGRQPMQSPDGRWTIVFNGEIYNFGPLRQKLEDEGMAFRGHSDTEVLLGMLASRGALRALRDARGMFAIAAWDAQERNLYLARDRLGEKPLYYGWLGDAFVFASELRALFQHPAWKGQIDRNALTSYLRYNSVPAPMSIFQGIKKLEPGALLTLNLASRDTRVEQFWNPHDVLTAAQGNPWLESPGELVTQLDGLIGSAVADQMVSDVPLGAFLSGGVDSSLIAALMQSKSSRPIRTFTIGFGEKEYDESGYARQVAGVLGTDHTEEHLSGKDALARVPQLPECYDEPFADSSQLPTMLVSEIARKHVTVCLSGDAGDELFGGYTRYPQVLNRWQHISKVPTSLRRIGSAAVNGLPDSVLALAGRASQRVRGGSLPDVGLSYRVRQKSSAWAHGSLAHAYLRSVSFWDRPEDVVVQGSESFERETELARLSLVESDPRLWMRYRDALTYLPDDILTKVDRASMHVSLESRIPLLDHRVVELAWRVPSNLCFHDGFGKWPLRALLARYIPEELINRPKMGFAVPLNDWLRGPLRGWAEDLLDPVRLEREGWFRPGPIRMRWDDLQAGGDSHELALWSILMFQAWKDHWSSAISS
jgi:asparagine synthase (glutamine-hydrolysing)